MCTGFYARITPLYVRGLNIHGSWYPWGPKAPPLWMLSNDCNEDNQRTDVRTDLEKVCEVFHRAP